MPNGRPRWGSTPSSPRAWRLAGISRGKSRRPRSCRVSLTPWRRFPSSPPEALQTPVDSVAALALGAQAVMIGTRLIATPEAYAHPVYKQKVLAATEDQTVRTTLFGYAWPNAPHRTLRTPFVERWLPEEARGSEQRPDEPRIGETKIGGQPVSLLRFMGFPPTPDASGDLEVMDFLAGQGVGLVKEIKSTAEVVREFVEGARHILSQLIME
jgi:nitronate monooxygenase